MGKVFLVGAGPGNPELLTVKAVRILARADVVLHDALVSREVLELVSPSARIINVGKRCGRKVISQAEINELLVRYASSAEIVVRLKSGDPLIFGRAGEEIETLERASIEVEVVPGITAALAAAATARISLTDRRTTDQILLISGHHEQGKQCTGGQRNMTGRTTVVVYMPGEYARVAERLRYAEMKPDTPCALISSVSTDEQQAYVTTMEELERAPTLPTPSILIAGEVARRANFPAMQWSRMSPPLVQSDLMPQSASASDF